MFLWWTVSLHQPPADNERPVQADQSLSVTFRAELRLAALLARYDRDTAKVIFEATWNRIPENCKLLALAEAFVIDPDAAEAALRVPQIPEAVLGPVEPVVKLLLSGVYGQSAVDTRSLAVVARRD